MKNYSTNLDSNDKLDRISLSLSGKEASNVETVGSSLSLSLSLPPLSLSLSAAKDQLCVNITSSLVQILKITQESWRQDFQQRNQNGGSTSAAATTPLIGANMLTHHRTSSGSIVSEEHGSASHHTHHHRTPSGRVIWEESGYHRRTPSGRVILEEFGPSSHPTHHRRTPSGRVLLEDGTSVNGDASRNAALSKMKQGLALLHSVRFVNETRQRMKFVPFLLRNSTGLPLTFATLTSAPSKVRKAYMQF